MLYGERSGSSSSKYPSVDKKYLREEFNDRRVDMKPKRGQIIEVECVGFNKRPPVLGPKSILGAKNKLGRAGLQDLDVVYESAAGLEEDRGLVCIMGDYITYGDKRQVISSMVEDGCIVGIHKIIDIEESQYFSKNRAGGMSTGTGTTGMSNINAGRAGNVAGGGIAEYNTYITSVAAIPCFGEVKIDDLGRYVAVGTSSGRLWVIDVKKIGKAYEIGSQVEMDLGTTAPSAGILRIYSGERNGNSGGSDFREYGKQREGPGKGRTT
ncbi:hypothetical protein AX774_g2122 [Zancudomyces culisetae]|uniref:Uncharacterized protein n=1 Tax=Zancudomyces culisetae TaxID=1213189 RepID=A0A1R1PTP8_ZANCU|nr:hypothetical protein AX774_g2122 [Zancudomyces culisetae]|eukprot:OMH84365.1 hypothetical protein AX774_g2122 [Zancudomyces culisetae]